VGFLGAGLTAGLAGGGIGFGVGMSHGTLAGSLSGAGTGALVGGLLAGPLGAIVGGIVGLIGGIFGGLFGGSKRRKAGGAVRVAADRGDPQACRRIQIVPARLSGRDLSARHDAEPVAGPARPVEGRRRKVFERTLLPEFAQARKDLDRRSTSASGGMGLSFAPPQFAAGGTVMYGWTGPRGGVMVEAHPGEKITNPSSSRKYGRLLDAINEDRVPAMGGGDHLHFHTWTGRAATLAAQRRREARSTKR
jgi:hypothetical protein